ncbi:MAG: adenosine deaminase [Ignavibacteriae bacterium HGW-Ignavibacteriae-4]|nr:MAG: adenosine deaminase [Ignavibacteriae bacterium HGW-Ignavibacteriae-4]
MRKIYNIVLMTIIIYIVIIPAEGSELESIARIDTTLNMYRNNNVKLRQIFQRMPKGGDLHHHYSGSIYAETYLKYIEDNDLWVNKINYEIIDQTPPNLESNEWSKISSIKADGNWQNTKVKIIESWSILYYNYVSEPTDEHFFATFEKFDIPKKNTISEGLIELRERAINENVSYIESMFISVGKLPKYEIDQIFDSTLFKLQETKDKAIQDSLEIMFKYYSSQSSYKSIANTHNQKVDSLHKVLKLDDYKFTIRYQNYVVRVLNPTSVFKDLILSFESASNSDLIVGVNIVAPENNTISMRDYWLHNQFFRFLKNKYKNVKTAMHAGELTLGLVKPEDLSWHIKESVFEGKADRIGHGVDIAYESNSDSVLKYMAENQIPVEINLTSNEFILGVKGSSHPISLYFDYNVPIVISTDDAGVLRTDMTEQYIKLFQTFSNFNYLDLKKIVYNSINYSFMNQKDKLRLIEDLDMRFEIFERTFVN